jgi:hypothetical protein
MKYPIVTPTNNYKIMRKIRNLIPSLISDKFIFFTKDIEQTKGVKTMDFKY